MDLNFQRAVLAITGDGLDDFIEESAIECNLKKHNGRIKNILKFRRHHPSESNMIIAGLKGKSLE